MVVKFEEPCFSSDYYRRRGASRPTPILVCLGGHVCASRYLPNRGLVRCCAWCHACVPAAGWGGIPGNMPFSGLREVVLGLVR